MSILTGMEILRPYIKKATGYKKSLLSSQHVQMSSGITLQTSIDEISNSLTHYIIEQGSNSNGYYRKWSDGTLEQWINMTVYDQKLQNPYGALYQGVRYWTYPIPFNSVKTIICGHFQYDTGASWGTVAGATATNAALRGIDVVSRPGGHPCYISAFAIGRWK